MSLQIIKSLNGQDEYVLLPVAVYRELKEQIQATLATLVERSESEDDYEDFDPADYVQNPIALARLSAGVKQSDLARALGVSQPYLSKLERAGQVSKAALQRVEAALATVQR